jgi:hypothetical protein
VGPSAGFAEPESLLPAKYIVDGENRITLRYEGESSLVVHHLWFYQ